MEYNDAIDKNEVIYEDDTMITIRFTNHIEKIGGFFGGNEHYTWQQMYANHMKGNREKYSSIAAQSESATDFGTFAFTVTFNKKAR